MFASGNFVGTILLFTMHCSKTFYTNKIAETSIQTHFFLFQILTNVSTCLVTLMLIVQTHPVALPVNVLWDMRVTDLTAQVSIYKYSIILITQKHALQLKSSLYLAEYKVCRNCNILYCLIILTCHLDNNLGIKTLAVFSFFVIKTW